MTPERWIAVSLFVLYFLLLVWKDGLSEFNRIVVRTSVKWWLWRGHIFRFKRWRRRRQFRQQYPWLYESDPTERS